MCITERVPREDMKRSVDRNRKDAVTEKRSKWKTMSKINLQLYISFSKKWHTTYMEQSPRNKHASITNICIWLSYCSAAPKLISNKFCG